MEANRISSRARTEERAGRLAVAGRDARRVAGRHVQRVDLIEGIARLALALKDEPLAVRRPVALAGAAAFDGEPADARQEVALLGLAAAGPAQRAGSQQQNEAGRTSVELHCATGVAAVAARQCACPPKRLRAVRALASATWLTGSSCSAACVIVVPGDDRGLDGRHAWAIYKLNRGVGDTVFLRRARAAVVPARRAAPRRPVRPDFHLLQGRGHRGRGSPLLPPSRASIRSRWTRAAFYNLRSETGTQGGSTITQQLARTLFLSNSRTYGRKVKEAALAVMLEIFLSKKEILELYLNRVYLSGGVYGVETMSQKMLRQAGVAADAGRGRADRRHHPRPGVLLALDALRRRASAQLRRPAADARGGEDHRRAGAGGARRSGSASSRRRR